MQARSPYLFGIVEDDPGLRADLVEFLELRGFVVRGFESAEAFFEAWPATSFDLLVLDVGLPGASGLEVAQRVRAQGATGIVILTAFDADDDHVTGLDAGADVFLSKRSSLEVIEAACHSVLRRLEPHAAARPESVAGEVWRMDTQRWHLTAPNGTGVDLTHAEVVLLSVLFGKAGQAVARDELLARLGKQETLSNLRNLDNAASRLRRKVRETCGAEFPVRTSYGKGYTFTGECETSA